MRLRARLNAILCVAAILAGCDDIQIATTDEQAKTPGHLEGEPAAASGAPQKSDEALNAEPRVTLVPIVPGAPNFQPTLSRSGEKYANDPAAVEAGRQLYNQMNCVGCHFNGGGGIGPALIDDAWIYGSSIDNIAATIFEGRPNGMPSFRHLVPEEQIWQLAAFVHGWAQGKGEAPEESRPKPPE